MNVYTVITTVARTDFPPEVEVFKDINKEFLFFLKKELRLSEPEVNTLLTKGYVESKDEIQVTLAEKKVW